MEVIFLFDEESFHESLPRHKFNNACLENKFVPTLAWLFYGLIIMKFQVYKLVTELENIPADLLQDNATYIEVSV